MFTNPLPGSYRRLGCYEAPASVGWSAQNRSQLVRLPAAADEEARIELRSPDPSCNPYVVAALLLEAGLRGIEQGLPLPLPSASESAGLPASLGEAVERAEKSELLHAVLPERFLHRYLDQKRQEFSDYQAAADPYKYEIKEYFDRV